MSKRSVAEWLGDIISWGERLEGHIAGMTYADFLKDAKTQDAASKCAESIGSLARRTFSVQSDMDFLVDCDPDTESAAFRILESEMRDFPFHFIAARELDEAKRATMMREAVDAPGIRAYSNPAD